MPRSSRPLRRAGSRLIAPWALGGWRTFPTTADTFNTYAWDSDGNTVGINLNSSSPINITYDAFDRAVEENNSGTYKQILYSPTWSKLALMTRQTANNVFLALPGGEQATYSGSTIRFRHYDWLGSARFESNMAEQEYGDAAYAPFGEPYSIKNTPYLSFTGVQQDTISGTYDFLYREYSPVQGRWIRPDPSGSTAADTNDPQSWNRYAYVTNDPLSSVDPLGLQATYAGFSGTGLCNIYPSAKQCLQPQPLTYLQQEEASYLLRLNLTLTAPPPGAWVPAGGDYRGTGCLRQQGGDAVWCPKLGPGTLDNCQAPFLCNSSGPAASFSAVPSALHKQVHKVTAKCMGQRLVDNFVGPTGSITVTTVLNVAAVAVFKPAVASLLPGPGWLYTGAAVAYDLGMVGKSYVECKYGGGQPLGETPADDQPEEPEP